MLHRHSDAVYMLDIVFEYWLLNWHSYIIVEPPTFTESGNFTIPLADNPCDYLASHFHLNEDSP